MLVLATPAAAHDFWIDLSSHRQPAATPIPIRFLIGDLADVDPWETQWRKVVSLRSHGPDGVRDQQASIRPFTKTDPGGASVTVSAPGTHVIAFESNQAENDIPAKDFNAYAEHEGLTPALDQRRRNGTTGKRGREIYSRRAKALVQVGPVPTDDAVRVIGQTLEIVPLANPYALPAGAPLPLRIYWHGTPLAGASVVLESLDAPGKHGTPVVTDAAGEARFALVQQGRWRANVVWTQPITHPRAEFETVFASLTFGY